MARRFFLFYTFVILLQFSLVSCLSNKIASDSDIQLKNYDTVNVVLESYCGKTFDDVVSDFGTDYLEGEEVCVFHSKSQESQITFSVKKGKVVGYSYDGSYADILTFFDNIPKYKDSEIQIASNAWLGFSPELLNDTFGSMVLKNTDKLIVVGPSEDVCIEFLVVSYTSTNSSETKRYIKKANVKGTYKELKDYIVKVPAESVPVKKIKQKNW